jgi:hypothetical protein
MNKAACASRPSSPPHGCLTSEAAKKIVAIASSKPLDVWSEGTPRRPPDRLNGVAEVEKPEFAELPAPAHLDDAGKKQYLAGQKIYFREGHCVTCHQPTAKVSIQLSPPLRIAPGSRVTASDSSKIAMYGLMGPH